MRIFRGISLDVLRVMLGKGILSVNSLDNPDFSRHATFMVRLSGPKYDARTLEVQITEPNLCAYRTDIGSS